MTTPQTPTPETDAAMKHMDATLELLKLARKLERERDEARAMMATYGGIEDLLCPEFEGVDDLVECFRLLKQSRDQSVEQLKITLTKSAEIIHGLEAELTQLRKVCDDQHKLITKNDEWHKEYDDYDGYPDSQLWEENQKCMADYSTLPHVIKAKDENSANV